MHAWAAIAIAQTALVAISLWRVLRERVASKRGIAVFVIAALATVVMVAEGGYWSAIALFATAVVASDALFLRSAVVASLCTKGEREAPPADEAVAEAAEQKESA